MLDVVCVLGNTINSSDFFKDPMALISFLGCVTLYYLLLCSMPAHSHCSLSVIRG